MYEFVILYCLVMGSGTATEARCDYIGRKNFVTASACYKSGKRAEDALRLNHVNTWAEVPIGERPSFVADMVCGEQSI